MSTINGQAIPHRVTSAEVAMQRAAGWPDFHTLDRDGINRMIRALRKARDAAFGADA